MNNIWAFIESEQTEDVAVVTISNAPVGSHCLSEILERIAQEGINIDMISQTPAQNGRFAFSFSILESDMRGALDIAGEFKASHPSLMTSVSGDMLKIKYHHELMKDMPGAAAQILKSFAAKEIEVILVTTSETSVSVLVRRSEYEA